MKQFGTVGIGNRTIARSLGFFLVVIGATTGVLFLRSLRADVVSIYPQQCLGTFYNPQNAQGVPQSTTTDGIDESNAAFSDDAIRELYCGNFMSADPDQGKIKSARLKFHWVLSRVEREEAVVIPQGAPEDEAGILQTLLDMVPDKEITIEFVSPSPIPESGEPSPAPDESPMPVLGASPEPAITPEPSFSPASSPAPEPSGTLEPALEPSPSPEPLPTPEPSPLSLWRNILSKVFPFAFAQEATVSPEPVFSSEPSPEQSAVPNDSLEPSTSTSPGPVPEQTPGERIEMVFGPDWDVLGATSSDQLVIEPDISEIDQKLPILASAEPAPSLESSGPVVLEVFYTLDSVTWQALGRVTETGWQEYEAIIPVNDWVDVAQFQIRIIAWGAVDYTVYTYIDAVALEVEYESNFGADEIEYAPLFIQTDFDIASVEDLKSDGRYVAAKVQTASGTALWVFDLRVASHNALWVSERHGIAPDSPLGIKQGSVFWIGGDGALYRFAFRAKRLFRQEVSLESPGTGVQFMNFGWQIFNQGNHFTFLSPNTGEMFSDDDRAASEAFYEKFLKDLPDTREDLVDLYLRESKEEPVE